MPRKTLKCNKNKQKQKQKQKYQNVISILIVVTHSNCVSQDDYKCDQNSLLWAQKLEHALHKHKNPKIHIKTLICHGVRAHGIDCNRKAKSSQLWRDTFTEGLDWLKNQPTKWYNKYILDVHSCFPKCTFPYIMEPKGQNIIDHPKIHEKTPTEMNYIIIRGKRKYGLNSILLEFTGNPKYKHLDRKFMNQLIKLISHKYHTRTRKYKK